MLTYTQPNQGQGLFGGALKQAFAPIKQALAPLGQALAPLGAQVQQAMQPRASPTFDMLKGTFGSPAIPKVGSLLQAMPDIEQARAQFQSSMSPVAQQLLQRIHQNAGGGQEFPDWFNQTGFPGMLAGSGRWPPELVQRLFSPEQAEMFRRLRIQLGGGGGVSMDAPAAIPHLPAGPGGVPAGVPIPPQNWGRQ